MLHDLLALLAQPRKTSGGWVSRCPSHKDRNPSLSIREGERGILLKCWAGCTLDRICQALGIHTRDLFYDTGADPRTQASLKRQAHKRRQQRKAVSALKGAQSDLLREAEAVIQAATGVDILGWTDEELDRAMDAVCRAHRILLEEERKKWTMD